MPAPKLIQTYALFVREGVSSAAREVKPASFTGASLGTVTDIAWNNEFEEHVFDKPIGGRWVDYDVICERDRLLFTLTIAELTPDFWKLLRAANPTLSAGGANYVPGSQLVSKGWLQVQQYTDGGARNDTLELFSHIKVETQEFGRGLIQARLTGRKLYSTLNSGTFENLTY